VLVTGDIAFSGKQAEYERATAWLRQLCASIDCPAESVWVVPGNHDVDRSLASDVVTKMIHDNIRTKGEAEIDAQLGAVAGHAQSAAALIGPLAEYNRFAAYFQCSISAEKPFWERDLVLSCGTTIRLRGLCSVLVSNAQDARGKMVLGRAQATVPRIDGVEYLTLCHHPPDWLCDQDAAVLPLESRVRIQLFGHKHSQRVQAINNTLRIIAGAMHPERNERDWAPMYNVIRVSRLDDQRIGVRLFQRRWHKADLRFVADQDPSTGMPHRDYVWQDCPRRTRNEPPAVEIPTATDGVVSLPAVAKTNPKDSDAMPPTNHERRLTYRFLTLPFRHQIAIANSLNVLTDQDRALNDEALFCELFKRATANGLLGKLWEETEKRHPDPAKVNPFENMKQRGD